MALVSQLIVSAKGEDLKPCVIPNFALLFNSLKLSYLEGRLFSPLPKGKLGEIFLCPHLGFTFNR